MIAPNMPMLTLPRYVMLYFKQRLMCYHAKKLRGEGSSSPRFAVMAYYATFLDRIPLARRDNSWESSRRDSNSSSSPESSRRRMSS